MSDEPPIEMEPLRLRHADRLLPDASRDTVAMLIEAGADLALLVDGDGVIRDVAADHGLGDASAWLDRQWSEVVTPESRIKVEEMLADDGETIRWRQVNHHGQSSDIPLRFKAIRLSNGVTVALGRDERATARLQQRLLQVQQSLERDYLRLRQAEQRYRLLFEQIADPLVVVEAATYRLREINPAAAALLGIAGVQGQSLLTQVAAEDRDSLLAYLGAASTGAVVPDLTTRLARGGEASLSARLFRQGGDNFYLVQLGGDGRHRLSDTDLLTLSAVAQMPDALVLTDEAMTILDANPAFLELVQMPTLAQAAGRPLADFVGRPGIDLDLIRAQVGEHRVARNVATIVQGANGGQEEVEVSAVRSADRHTYAFTLRLVARRLRDLPPVTRDLPRSVEQLTELVGRVPLKDIVRESTDLIERLCIEAALTYTSNNRASAAEILGLSRQSLYSKLHRHGLGRPEESEPTPV